MSCFELSLVLNQYFILKRSHIINLLGVKAGVSVDQQTVLIPACVIFIVNYCNPGLQILWTFSTKILVCVCVCCCVCVQIVEEVLKLNEDPRVHGVYLHLPPASLTSRVLNTLKPEKDVDG